MEIIIGIGTDIANINRIKKIFKKKSYSDKIFSKNEINFDAKKN